MQLCMNLVNSQLSLVMNHIEELQEHIQLSRQLAVLAANGFDSPTSLNDVGVGLMQIYQARFDDELEIVDSVAQMVHELRHGCADSDDLDPFESTEE